MAERAKSTPRIYAWRERLDLVQFNISIRRELRDDINAYCKKTGLKQTDVLELGFAALTGRADVPRRGTRPWQRRA